MYLSKKVSTETVKAMQRNPVTLSVQDLFRNLCLYLSKKCLTETVTRRSVMVLRFPFKYYFVAYTSAFLNTLPAGQDWPAEGKHLARGGLCLQWWRRGKWPAEKGC